MFSSIIPRSHSAIRNGLITFGGIAATLVPCGAQSQYHFGNPTAEEQAYIELINRARANPAAEGARLANTTDPVVLNAYSYFSVDLAMMQAEFNAIPAQAPLAPNANLTTAARGHSAWMLANNTQAHDQTTPSNTPFDRISASGYLYQTAGENIFASAKSVWHGHAGFQVDWGYGSGGMQDPRGHRNSIHSANFREIGVGVLNGSAADVGPQLVTQDFGARFSNPSLGTGVAYYDLNGNNFYDVGEGISGLTVNVTGTTDYCETAIGGGWVVPIPSTAATRSVRFSGLDIDQNVTLSVAASSNAKADLKLAYTPPAITSASDVTADAPHSVEFTPVAGATAYQWKRWTFTSTADENCETTSAVTSSTTGSYPLLNTVVKQQGTSSFNLRNTTGDAQWLELNPLYHGGDNPTISYQSRIRWATANEYFKVQIKEDGSTAWQDIDTQSGTGTAGQSSFSPRSAALTGMSGKPFRIRFLTDTTYDWYNGTGDHLGWFIDAISFSDVSTLENPVTQTLSGNTGSFSPATGTYLMSISPVISGTEFPGPMQVLTATETPADPTFASWAADHETSNGLVPGTLSNASEDYDHDGWSNLMEYAFGTSPVSANEAAPRMPLAQTSATHFIIQYQRDTELTDLSFTAEAATNLQNWMAPGETGAPTGFVEEVISTSGTLETREARVPMSSDNQVFLRVKVSKN